MPSARTEPDRSFSSRWARFDPRGPLAPFRRLNLRLVGALAGVSLVSLLVSGLAINQILPGYFAEQTLAGMRTSAVSTGILLQQRVADATGNNGAVAELRDGSIVPRVAEDAARFFNVTVTIINDAETVVGHGTPVDPAALEAQGLNRDTAIGRFRADVTIDLPPGAIQPAARYDIIVSEPYSARAETLRRIQDALLGAGLLALVVSLVIGVVAARSLTVPIGRLRRASARVAQGHLDERVLPSGVLEIDELGQQFNVMADRLSGSLRMLEADRDRLREFVADVSHELRTPIAALRLYTELQRDGDVDEATRREFLERSTEQIGRLEWLSTNLLDLSRIDAGIFPLDMRDGDLRDPVQAVVQALSEVAVERGVSLDSTVPADPVELHFDRERIVQLLTNLVGNALKFTDRGGSVSVRLITEAGPETPAGAPSIDGDEVMIEVRDTGPGIPPDELPHIFERFYRGTNTGDARASGSGLGLAIVRSIVEMHGGRVDVASVLDEGTVFRIILPRRRDPAPEANANVNDSSRAAHPARNQAP
jgi:two-component system sensor histidine kinase MtrB